MKIDDSTNKLPLPPVTTGRPAQASEASATRSERTDKVSLSGATKAAIEAGRQPPIDTAKVERIREAIAQGEFRIDPERIANDMLAGTQDLLAQRR